MKAKLITKQEFQPVTIELTFETRDEFNTMYEIVNCNSTNLINALSEKEFIDYSLVTVSDWENISNAIHNQLIKLK